MALYGRRATPTPARSLLTALATAALALLPLQGLAAAPARAATLTDDPASLVNPLIGTSGAVDTFPGADVPFGMVQWSPDTAPDRPDGGGYEYGDKAVSGYSLTHLSGPGCPAAGDLPVLPWTGALSGNLGATRTGFDHAHESAQAGYYRLTDAAGVRTELTTTTRAGIGRFTFPPGSPAHLLLKLSGGATKIDGTRAQIVGDNEVVGAIDSGHFCGAANTYTLHFDIRFDRPFTESGTWVGSTVTPGATRLRLGTPAQRTAPATRPARREPHFTLPARTQPQVHGAGTAAPRTPPVTGANGVYLGFDTTASATVTARVGISYTSDANAARNLAAEIPGWHFDAVRAAAHRAWNTELGAIRIGGGSADQRTQFYTALYHALLHPNVFSDVNGQYMGMDHQVHRLAKGQHAQYANYSGWDIYRSQAQLMALVDPRASADEVTSMLNGFDQTGLLPKWAQNDGESYVMVGDPADGIIAGAYAFGARGFDTRHALTAMVYEATHRNNDRPGEAIREAKGYLPIDGSGWGCCNFYGPVSTQLEYDSADYAIAALARNLGDQGTYAHFAARAQDWQNVFDPQSGYLQARLADGQFAPGFTPGTSNGFVEGTSSQYTPMVPFNLRALIQSRGGDAAWNTYLDSLLSNLTDPGTTNADLSNEPSVEIPWEYDWTGEPWKAQQAVRAVQQQLWFDAPVGSFGNDDLGAMSSWYVWSALGMYPEIPGTDTLALGSPVFPVAQLRLAHGRTLALDAPAAATDHPYVHALRLNGTSWNRPWLTLRQLAGGGTLRWDLGTAPDTSWGSAPAAAPPSDPTGERPVLASTGPSTGAGLVVAPGATGDGSLDLANISDRSATVAWQATAPAGVSLAGSGGTLTLPAYGSAHVPLRVTAGSTEGRYTIPVTVTADGSALPATALDVAVAAPGELWPYRTNTGVQPDGSSFSGGFDDQGWAYSQNALAAAGVRTGGTVTADGISYPWPSGTGKPDNIESAGQTIALAAPAGASALGLLGAGTNAPPEGAGGAVLITYTDGSTGKATVSFPDWTLNGGSSTPPPGATVAVTTPYRDTDSGGRDTTATYLFSTTVPLDPAKQVASVTLPVTGDGTLHVFTIGFRG